MITSVADKIIEDNGFEGIRDQDGWETLELTVREYFAPQAADVILAQLKETQE